MRWGIVGTGAIAAHFARACMRSADSSCVAVASRTQDSGENFANNFSIGRAVQGTAALVALKEVDVVYIATPNHCHVSDALAVIGAGKPVLCEKPLSVDAAGARRIADAARCAGVFCMEGLWSLCTPVYRNAFDRVRAGEIGELREIQGSFGSPQSPSNMPRLFDPAQGGGALLDRGVYLIALSQVLLGDLELRHVSGDLSPEGVDLSVSLVLENAQGARALLSAAIDRLQENRLTLSGSIGRCSFSDPVTCPPSYSLSVSNPDAAFKGPSRKPGTIARLKEQLQRNPRMRQLKRALTSKECWFVGGLEHEITEVEACLLGGLKQSPRVPLERSIKALDLIVAAREQLVASRIVEV